MPEAAVQLREVEPMSALALELGRNIRALRKGRSMTLEQLATRAELSVSFLSLIERGKKKPSLSALQSIAGALGMEVGWFFAEHAASDPLERAHVVRKAFRRKIAYTNLAETDYLGEVHYLLSPNIDGKLAMVMMEIAPGCSSGDDLFSHDGEEVGYVLTGELTLELDERELKLGAGDSFGFEGKIPHRYNNKGTEPLQFVLVNTPVIFGARKDAAERS